ncbi:MAG: hypothetical protein ACRDKU_07740 [Gaiellaceae bacterium]
MELSSEELAVHGDLVAETCESCGGRPACRVTIRRHVGMFYLQRFVTVKTVACRACGRRLVRDFTLRTLAQGWWGLISFFFNWFVLAANAFAWLRLGRLNEPSLWPADGSAAAPAPVKWEDGSEAEEAGSKTRSWLVKGGAMGGILFAGLVLLGLGSWGWDAAHHDHDGPHGGPVTALGVKSEMTGQMFLTEAGGRVRVESATCAGDGGNAVRSVHFRCHLVFDNGEADDVLVHVQPDELFFRSSLAGGA